MFRVCVSAALVAMVLGGFAIAQEPSSQTSQAQGQMQRDGAAQAPAQSDGQATNQKVPLEQEDASSDSSRKADKDADKRAEEAREYWPFHILGARLKITDSLLALFTFLLIIVGGVQGFFLYRTDQGTHKAADAATKSADAVVAQLRSYIGIQSGGVFHATVDNQPGYRFQVELKNSGSTPAFDFTTWLKAPVIADPKSLPFGPAAPLNERTSKSVLTSGASAHIHWNAAFKENELAEIRSGAKAIFVWGGADYTDAFGNRRHFLFREMMGGREDNPPNGWALKPHPAGYDAD